VYEPSLRVVLTMSQATTSKQTKAK